MGRDGMESSMCSADSPRATEVFRSGRREIVVQVMEAEKVTLAFPDNQSLQKNVQCLGNYLFSSWCSLRLIIKQKMDQINSSSPPSATKV